MRALQTDRRTYMETCSEAQQINGPCDVIKMRDDRGGRKGKRDVSIDVTRLIFSDTLLSFTM